MPISHAPLLQVLLLRRTRQLGLTLGEVAERAQLTRAYLRRLAMGQTANPGIKTLEQLASALQVPSSAVFRLFLASTPGTTHALQSHRGLPPELGGAGDDDVLAFVADVSVPDHSVMMPGERFTKTWAVQNCGTLPWQGRWLERADRRFFIGEQDGKGGFGHLLASHLSSMEDRIAVSETLPGQVVELSVEFAAPRESCSVASVWRMVGTDGRPCFGAGCYLQVVVTVLGL
jgi:transcriptional regulator with XRE-family HTH domain